ncbi:MAG: SDR family oxidoreductase [Bdellovibrionales bacterium]|nr:SDR family oxidoreductase [Bdellovibrionales bacterium]MCB0414696.1 SDR family oxidoreductase [Bdellovibrionales bacterium]
MIESEKEKADISPESIKSTIAFIETLVDDTEKLGLLTEEERKRLLIAAGKLSRPDKLERQRRGKKIRSAQKRAVIQHDRELRTKTGIRSARQVDVFTAPLQITSSAETASPGDLKSPRTCYVCLAKYSTLHHFYDTMCPSCAEFNYQKRFQTASLKGQVALITGSRLKIGYQATLMMLRAGAKVIATTRFPKDSALRYAREPDFKDWGHRLHIYGLDLRHTPSVEIFSRYIEQKYDRLDLLLNNAAQTVRRPPGFYQHLMENEERPLFTFDKDEQQLLKDHDECIKQLGHIETKDIEREKALPAVWHGHGPGVGLSSSAHLSLIPYTYDESLNVPEIFPDGRLDADLQQVDLRTTNSWRLKIGEVNTSEMLEVHLINAVAPFVLCNRLTPMMKRDFTGQKHIVNVTAMEGKFQRFKKEPRHPHTNMAKAALNMLTNTISGELATHGIFVNAVDTGWVTDEDPVQLSKRKEEIHDFQPPLDIVDGAARICDPFFDGILTGKHWSGKFLKDYRPIDW